MTDDLVTHLSADDLDAWLGDALPVARERHLNGCAACQELARSELALVAQLQTLGHAAPSTGFADRIMASVVVADPFAIRALWSLPRRIAASRRSLAVAATLAFLLLGSMAGSIGWTLYHPQALALAGSTLVADAGDLFWVGLRAAVSNFIEQPWYDSARTLLATPSRVALGSASASLLYLLALVAFRRLLTLPAPRVASASL